MPYILDCRPDSAAHAQNIRLLPNGRITFIFNSNSGEHADTSKELHQEVSKAVLSELTSSPVFLKYRRAVSELASAQKELLAMDIQAQTDALQKQREYIENEVPSGAAQKLQDIDRQVGQLAEDAKAVRGRISLLEPMVDTLRGQCEKLASGLSKTAVNKQFETLRAREIKASAALSKAAGVHVKALADIKSTMSMVTRYQSPEFGALFCNMAMQS